MEHKMTTSTHIDIRVFRILKDMKTVGEVQHIHFKSWEDFKIPKVASYPKLLELLDNTADNLINVYKNMVTKKAEPERVMIHCMAGLGRTGTFISILQAAISIKVQQQ